MSSAATRYEPAEESPARHRHSVSETIIRYALIIGVMLTPFMMWRFHPDIQFTLSDGCFLMAALLATASGRLNLKPFADMSPWWLFSFCLMLFALGASSLVNGDPIRFTITGSQYVFAYLALPFLLFAGTWKDEILLAKFFVAAVVAAEAFSVALFYYYGENHASAAWINQDFITGAGRLGSFTASANRNAALISLTLPFVLYFAKMRLVPLWICLVSAAILMLALVLTASVTGFVSSIAAILIFALASYGWRAWKPISAAVGVLILAFSAGLPIPDTFEERVLSAFETGDISEAGTYGGRMQLIEEAWQLSDNTHLLGIGADQFRSISVQGAPVHNIILLIWTEGGMFALLGWTLAMGILALIALRTIKYDKAAAALALSVALSFFIISNASTHVYARLWVVPILIATRFAVTATLNAQRQAREQREVAPPTAAGRHARPMTPHSDRHSLSNVRSRP